jgi:hypothetical protein
MEAIGQSDGRRPFGVFEVFIALLRPTGITLLIHAFALVVVTTYVRGNAFNCYEVVFVPKSGDIVVHKNARGRSKAVVDIDLGPYSRCTF